MEHPAIVSFDENTKVLLKIPPPSLHVCLLGPTNDIIHHLEKIYPDVTKILDIDLHLVREDYQGKTYEGKFSSRVCFQNIIIFGTTYVKPTMINNMLKISNSSKIVILFLY